VGWEPLATNQERRVDKEEGVGELRRRAELFERRAESGVGGIVCGRLMASMVLGCDTDRRVGMAEAADEG